MYFDMAFNDFIHLRWLSSNNCLSGRTSFKTNSMFTLLTNLGTFSGGYTVASQILTSEMGLYVYLEKIFKILNSPYFQEIFVPSLKF